MLLADRLAEYSRSLAYDALPEEAVHEAKRRFIDSIACAYGAWRSETAQLVRKTASTVRSSNGATVIGTDHKASPDWTAFANGLMIRYLDYNDTYLSKEPAHPSDNWAAILAIAESEGCSGRDAILAAVLSYEIQCRLCDAASLRSRGWDHVNYGLFSAAAAAGRLMNLDAKSIRHAMSIAGVSGLAMRQTRVGELSDWKGCAFANSSRHACMAAMLVKEGMTGPSEIFEGKMGFMKQVSGPFELGALGGEEGRGFMINDTYIKYFPVEYHAQSAVWAALELRDQAGGPENIASVKIRTFEASYSIIGSEPEKWRPQSRETADHSLPYITAAALWDGKVDLASFDEEKYTHEALLEFTSRIVVEHDTSLDPRYPEGIPNHITVITRDGRSHEKEVTFPRGHNKNPMTDQEVEEKFRRLADGLVPTSQQDRILAIGWGLDNVANMREAMAELKA